MSIWDDIGNGVGNFFGNLGKAAMSPDGANTPGDSAALKSAYGGADIGAQQTGAASPMPSYSGNTGMNLDNLNAMGNAAIQGNQQQPQGLNSAVIDAVMRGISTPAIDPNIMSQAFNGLGNIQHPDYLGLTKDAFAKMQDQVKNMQDTINGGYNQVGTDMGDLYKANQQAATLGNNNILQQIGQAQGAAQQGSAANNVNALANLKNSELATRAAVAQQGGMPQAQGDYMRTDPSDVQAAGMLANAQQSANNANGAALDRTNMNNEMANALGNQGAIMHQQLENNRMGYNSSVGKYMTDLTNQEAQREMDASKQNYADQMQQVMARYGMAKDSADLNIKKVGAFVGSRGLPAMLQDIGIGNMDNAKAQATMDQAGNVDPARTALAAYPQFANAYNTALANGMGLVSGTKPTYADVYKAMANDPSVSGNGNDLINFAQMVTSPKALSDGSSSSPYDLLMSQFQGS